MTTSFKQSTFVQITFVISVTVSLYAVYLFDQYSYQEKRISTQKIASSYAGHIRNTLHQAFSATYPLAALIRTQNGRVAGFTELATEMLPLYPGIASLQLQPNGVIKHLVPLQGNEGAIGHNLLLSPDRNKEAFLARDTGKLTLAGPFKLVQGGFGAAARLPIYLKTPKGKQFWGFAGALIRFPDILETAKLPELIEEGIAYQLSRIHPDTGEVHIISSSNTPLIENPLILTLNVPNGLWTFYAFPVDGWRDFSALLYPLLIGLLFIILATTSSLLWSRQRHSHQRLEQIILKRTKALKDNIKLLIHSEEQLRLSQIAGGIGTWEYSFITDKYSHSDVVYQQLGFTLSKKNSNWDDVINAIYPEDRAHVNKVLKSHLEAGSELDLEYRITDTNGKVRWIRGVGRAEFDADNKPTMLRGTVQEITQQKKSEVELKLSSRVFSETHDGIFITNDEMNIVDINPAFCDITGYSREELMGQNPRMLSSGKQTQAFYDEMLLDVKKQDHWRGEVWNRKKDGDIYIELLTLSVLKDEQNNVVNYVGIFTDITKNKKQQEQLNLMAHYDPLTNLPNRALFTDRFHQSIAHSKNTGNQLAICFLDLDDFKPVNDNYGHNIGDRLLVEVAKRITANIRVEDTVSRQGGDEFALLLNDIESVEQCKQTLERLQHALAEPYIIDSYPHKISVSSGVTLYPYDKGDIDTLLRHADQAMYQAKLAGKHRYHFFNPEEDQRTIQKHQQLDEITQALNNNEFQLYYQPKVNMRTGKVVGAEALIRWLHPEKGLIPPLDFLPLIEGTELEIQVGGWVINEALQQLDTWQQRGIKLEVSINIASHHLQSSAFFDQLNDAITRYPKVDPQDLQLEILESSALGDLMNISDIIINCQETLGINVALDDFGTGYSSLTHLRHLPAHTIKIDQSFVRDMLDDKEDLALIEGIIGLAEAFNRQVIAEGVETTEHGVLLMRVGCDFAQGYAIAKPMPAGELAPWMRNYTPDEAWSIWGHANWEMNNLHLIRAQREHVQWIQEIFNLLEGQELGLQHQELTNHHECRLGKWYGGYGEKHYQRLTAFRALEGTHINIHKTGYRVIKLYNENKKPDAELLAKDLLALKNQFLEKLNTLQKQINASTMNTMTKGERS
ncbi:MAG: EAL domain-containing protein [Cycloclasticus sp.]